MQRTLIDDSSFGTSQQRIYERFRVRSHFRLYVLMIRVRTQRSSPAPELLFVEL